ncbi:hypothetical protein CK203_031742 [Vitis vinifera]|uniref:Uncharacterized protein n=1 Tax=Vitis vinifera TaxID=29760 RepID=A0A438I3J1_VITVI|nr:hypothetical protein CK203_031742 [Vitis vinifera]
MGLNLEFGSEDVARLEEAFSVDEEFMKDEVMGFFRKFHEHGRFGIKARGSSFALSICDWDGALSSLINKAGENLEVLALELGCKVGMLPSSYLELPWVLHINLMAVWDGVEERFRKRLAL